jgi:anti-anti-sigma regulatory factor
MLKITTETDETGTILDLAGKLAGPWVQELERCWRETVKTNRRIKVRLNAVTFIDDAGKRLLAEIHRQGAELAAEGCMTKAITEEIKRG